MSQPVALLLDFGGVLTTDLWESIRAATRRAGLPENVILDLMRDDPEGHAHFTALERGDITQAEYEPYLAGRIGVPPDGLLADLCADLRPDEAMWKAISVLRQRGVRLAVVSNSWGAGYFSPYAGWGLQNLVDAIVISHEVGMRKPEPGIFALALDLLGVRAAGAVFVDDIASNLEPARAMGMRVVHHTDSGYTVAELQRQFTAADGSMVSPSGTADAPT